MIPGGPRFLTQPTPPSDEDRRAAALTLAIEAHSDDPAYRIGGAEVRADRIVSTAGKFEAYLRGDGVGDGDPT